MLHRPIGPILAIALVVVGAACSGSSTSSSDDAGGSDPVHRGPQGSVAQFIVQCELSHLAFDDPIVYPDEPGASHLHQFFGNAAVDSDPDYDRVSGAETSCRQAKDTASYWAPALLDVEGRQVEARGMTAYYRPGRGVDPADVVAYPPGLMLVAGDMHATEPQSTEIVAWSCGTGASREVRPPICPPSSTLRMIVRFPDCWDGTSMSSLAHDPTAAYSVDGCPDDQPIAVPQLTLAIDYPPVAADGLRLASGDIITGHADFWNVWDQRQLEEEVLLCINRDLVCGVSDVGSSR